MEPIISVIIPAYNAEKTIKPCLEALKSQSYSGTFEILVVDDKSADKTVEAVRKMSKRSKNIRVIEQEHLGPAAARNRGAKEARGDILIFTDSDCIADRDFVKEMGLPLQGDIAGVQGRYKTMQKSLVARFCQLEIEDRYSRMLKRPYIDFIGSYAAAYRKDIFQESGGFDQGFRSASGEDPELSFRLAIAGHKLVFNPKAIVYHTHPESLGKYLKVKFYRAYWRVRLYKKHPGKAVSESYTPQSLKIQIGLFYLFILSVLPFLAPEAVLNFMPFYWLVPPAIIILLFLTTIPLSLKIMLKDFKVGLVSPAIIFLRSIVFGLGLLEGTLRNV